MKVLVAVASHGTANDQYLARVINEYRSMPFDVDIVVLSNAAKSVPPNVELLVGLPSANPWSLPFAHKEVFAKRISDYDLFIYSEDDILVSEKNVRAFLRLSSVLPENEIPGFLRFEMGPDGRRSFPEYHVNFRWQPGSVRSRNEYTLAFFTNEHAGCYALTQRQLRRAIASGGFLVEPHQGRYDLACSAATDPYTQCGFEKLICISHISEFLVHHLSDKYAGKYGLDENAFDDYLEALLRSRAEGQTEAPFKTDSSSLGGLFSKDYYEPIRHDLISLIPASSRSVLSIGSGWGATEEQLARSGCSVTVVALDPVMSSWAKSRGLEVLSGDLATVRKNLKGRSFDCLLASNILHLAADPADLLSCFVPFLSKDCVVIATTPNLPWIKVAWKRIRDSRRCHLLGNFSQTGVHTVSRGVASKWFKDAGLSVERFVEHIPQRLKSVDRGSFKLLRRWLASELIAVGRPSSVSRPRGEEASFPSTVVSENDVMVEQTSARQ